MIKNVENSKTKDVYWQYVRAICIICVILIHCKTGIEYKNSTLGAWNFDYWLVMRQFINFPVAIFIFLSGYFTNIESLRKVDTPYNLARGGGRFLRLLLPFWIWSTFYTIINLIRTSGNVDIARTLIKLVLGLSSGQLYFILVLLQLTIITPFLIRRIEKGRGAKYLFLVTPLYLLILYLYFLIYKQQLPFYQIPFPAWFNFYYLGLWIKIKGYKPIFKRNNILNSIILCVAGLIFSIIESYLLLSLGSTGGFASSQIKVSSFLYVFAIINLLIIIKPYMENLKIKWLENIGDSSYGIYYIHMFWIIVSTKILSLIPYIDGILPIYQLLQLIFVIFLSYISIQFTKKTIGDKISRRYLGF